MKSRKYRRSENFMKSVYERGYGIRPPYQLLVDHHMCLASYRHKFEMHKRLAKVLGAPVQPMVTGCVMAALHQGLPPKEANSLPAKSTNQAEAYRYARGAYAVGRNLELRRCRHTTPLPILDCFRELIGLEGQNPHHYGLVTNDDEVKRWARTIKGLPLIYLERTFPLLEAPTRATRDGIRLNEKQRIVIPEFEKQQLKREFGELNKPSMQKIHRHRKPKGPNPLSVKKASKKSADLSNQPQQQQHDNNEPVRKKRKRRH